MPDYDTRNIPVLDDVIKDEVKENATSKSDDENAVNFGATPDQAENTPDLFSGESDRLLSEASEPEIGVIDEADVFSGDEPVHTASDYDASALINYDTDEGRDAAVSENQSIESSPQTPVELISLEATVEGIVKRLMPDLEQQLRSLIQQALEEKLPNEIIDPVSTDNNNDQAD